MRNRRNFSDQDIDRLLAGKAPNGGEFLDEELAALVRDVRTAFAAAPSPEIERLHLAAAMEASRLAIEKGDPVVRPASKAHGPDRQASGLPKWRRRTVLSSLFASMTAKIAGVAIAATATAGGLAAAGALPAPAQQAISQAASSVGITLPAPHTSHESEASHAATSTAGDDATSTVTGDDSPTSTAKGVSSTATDDTNHGACVSYAAHVAASLGMTGSLKGQFVSAVAQDSSAISAKVPDGGKPDAACQAAIDKARAAATSPGNSGDTHGKPNVTATATSGTEPNSGPGSSGPGSSGPGNSKNHDATNQPTSTVSPATGANPAANPAPTEHRGKP